MSDRSWDEIPPANNCTDFSYLVAAKLCCCLERPKINKMEVGEGPFKNVFF